MKFDSSTKKIITVLCCILVTLCGIGLRLWYLQIYLQSDYQLRAQLNFLRTEKINSRRGNILDCTGRQLATNRPITNVYWQGTGQRQLSGSQKKCLEELSIILNKDFATPSFISLIKETERFGKIALLAEDLSFEQLSKIMEQLPYYENLNIATQLKRCYPYKQLACHIIGYISNAIDYESSGKMGLEKIFESLLKGETGQLIKTINSFGLSLYQEEIKKSLAGQDILTTIDLSIQQLAESAFPSQYAGAMIIMDPKTGALRAVLSRPMFNPELFLNPINKSEWELLQFQRPFINRAFNACYPPASIFKLVTLGAALETNLINPDTTIYCRGFTKFRGRKYHCNNKLGHGVLTITQALAQSCNPLFYEIGKKLPIDVLAEYAQKFGLGQKTNIIFPESNGIVPNRAWKKIVKGEPWWPGETLSVVIGQSYLLVTPLQVACMISSIFCGYRVKPRILENEPIECQPTSIKPETREFIKSAMKAGVDEGTSKTLRKIKDIQIHAKTGTAQIKSLEKQTEQDTADQFEHAWFAAHIQYEQEEPLMLVIMAEHAKSSKVATQIGKNFLLSYRDFMKNNRTIIQPV